MKLIKREFRQGYDKSAFYAEMGIFFAEREFRKELPYLINSDQKEWCLFYEDGRLVSFYAHEEKADHTAISGFYVLPGSRKNGLSAQMLDDILENFEIVRLVTCNQRLLTLLNARHFQSLSRRGNYLTMEWRKEHESAALNG